jgi:hypothetical protein
MSGLADEYELPEDPGDARRDRLDTRVWRARLREQGRAVRERDREIVELQRQLAEEQRQLAKNEAQFTEVTAATEQAAALAAELAAERQAQHEAEQAYLALAHEPVGVSPEDRRAAERVQAALDGAMPQADGLDGMLAMLLDRTMSWPQQQEVMRAFGFRDAPPPTS